MSMPALSASLTYEKNALFGRRRQDHGLWLGAKVESRFPSWYLICSQENELTCKLSAILVVATIVAVTLVALARAGDSQTQEKQVPWL